MSDTKHLECTGGHVWCGAKLTISEQPAFHVISATCLACLLACAEYGSEARHRYEVLREGGANP